ncbi:MAG: tetratricopeptide repeat protein [Candidatus Symbiodolus clandestinus]
MSMADPLFVTEKQPLEDAKELNAQGLLLSTGCGVPQDHYLALIHFKKAAQLGNIDALYNLAVAYEYGLGVVADQALAMKYHLKAAQQGSHRPDGFFKDWADFKGSPQEFFDSCLEDSQDNLTKLYYVGRCFETGFQAMVDYQLARQYYQMAADQGCDEAKIRLGYLFEHGLSVPRDPKKAFACYQQANGTVARFHQGRCYRQGIGCSLDLEEADYRLFLAFSVDFRPAVYEYVALAEAGLAPAQAYLGNYYLRDLDDKTIQQNYPESLHWLKLAAKQQDINAIYYLGMHFLYGRSVKPDYRQAFEQFLKSAERGLFSGQRRAAFAYRDGQGVARDYVQALFWFQQAAKRGCSDSKASMGFLYFNGLGGAKDFSAALDWFTQAAEQGSSWGYYGLGLLYEKGCGVEQNYPEAVRWYQKAQEYGHSLALAKLNFFWIKGLANRPYRLKKSTFEQYALFKSDFDALYYAAIWLQAGGKSYCRAFRYYQLAAESGHLDAQNNLGVLFEEGQGVKQDYRKALKWYKSAAEQGNCAAQFNVGRCYQLGYGTFQGLEKAFEYYCLAWRHQCVQAGNNLGVYYTLKWLKNTGMIHCDKRRFVISSAPHNGVVGLPRII